MVATTPYRASSTRNLRPAATETMAESESDAQDLEALVAASASEPDTLRCCCGRPSCVFLKHNCSVLENVENDVNTAARLGQALLVRHEAYMASAERERGDTHSRVAQLEMEKSALEAENARTIEENRVLLDQLEALNSSVSDSEVRIMSLETSLRIAQQTARRLETAAARAAEMEKNVAMLENEQASLRLSLMSTESDARTALQRWRKAERGITDLQAQLERMEKESHEEQRFHEATVQRLEKQNSLRSAEPQAAKSGNNKVVSHFVRDILQDNASLQISMAELRQLLTNSNDEVQALREQLMLHQPVDSPTSTIRAEIISTDDPTDTTDDTTESLPLTSQQYHVHHHYHVTNKAEAKKPRKKRLPLHSGVFAPYSGGSGASTGSWHPMHGSVAPTVISGSNIDSVSTVPSSRWSVFSEEPSDLIGSSAPTSPVSDRRGSGFESENSMRNIRSGSPASSEPWSPVLAPRLRQTDLDAQSAMHASRLPSLSEEDALVEGSTSSGQDETQKTGDGRHIRLDPVLDKHSEILEDEVSRMTPHRKSQDYSALDLAGTSNLESHAPKPTLKRDAYPSLRRAGSHESIMSLSGGLDIHTLKIRPSQLSLRPVGVASANTSLSAVTAAPTITRSATETKRGSMILRENFAGMPSSRLPAKRAISGPVVSVSANVSSQSASSGLTKLVKGWRPWNTSTDAATNKTMAPTQATSNETAAAVVVPLPINTARPNPATQSRLAYDKFLSRTPGINQPGAIPGFQEYLAASQRRKPSSQVKPMAVDTEALREGLGE